MPSLRLSAGELEMLDMLWRHGPVTIQAAHDALGLSIGYTTVQTRLNRLVKKGAAQRTTDRPAKYSAALSPADVRQTDLELLVHRVSEGRVAPLVAHLLESQSVSRDELAELKKLLADAEARLRSPRAEKLPRKPNRRGKP